MPRLTNRLLGSLAITGKSKDRLVFDTVCPGLGVRLTSKGTRTFIGQWTDPATKRKVREPLGVWGALTIDQARDAVKTRLGQVAKGVNPRAERFRVKSEAQRERAEVALSFERLVADWAALHLTHRRPRYRDEAQRAIRRIFADLLNRPAARVTRGEVVSILDGLVKSGRTAMAGSARAYGRAAFQWAVKRGELASNPFAGLPISTKTAARERVLSDAELSEVWSATAQTPYPWGAFFRIAILTLQRRDEVAAMRWSEISKDLRTWAIPGSRMKNGKGHIVHLPDAAQAVLREIARMKDCDFVFSTTGKTHVSGFSKAKAMLDAEMIRARRDGAVNAHVNTAPLTPWRLHDLRRTGVSTLARLGFDSIIADKLLAHQPAKLRGVAAIYQRYDFATERARALDAWAAHILSRGNSSGVIIQRVGT